MSGDKLFEKVKALMDYLETYPAMSAANEGKALELVEQAWQLVDRRKVNRRG
jgi:hypothetical protein